MVKRQLPNPSEIFELLHFKTPELNPKRRRLDAALTTWDLRKIAKRRTPAAAFDYTDGAAEGEVSLRRARQAFRDIEFHPDILHPALDVDTSCEILGGRSAMPFGIAPTGFTRLMQTEGEVAGAGAAGAAGIPFTLSTLGTTSIEDVKAANPHGRNWFHATSPTGWSSAPPQPASTPSCSPSTPPWPGPACATSATDSPSRPRSRPAPSSTRSPARGGGSTS